MTTRRADDPGDPASPVDFDADVLRPSGALLAAQIALGAAIERRAVAATGRDATTLDLLVRLGLAPERQLRAIDLCDQLKLSPSHVSRMLDRAEDAGLVTREPDPGDRRAKIVVLTPRGRAVASDFAPRLHTVLQHTIHDVLDAREIDRLVELLTRIEQAADTYAGDSP